MFAFFSESGNSLVSLFLTIFLRVHTYRGTLMEIRTVLDIFLGHLYDFRSRGIFSLSYASLLFNYFIIKYLIVALFLFVF